MTLTSPAERLVLLHAARALFAMAVAGTESISGGVAALGEAIAGAIARCAHEARRRIRSVALLVFEQLRRIFDAVPSYVDVAERLLAQV